jgi:hypothetical protein
LPLLSGYADALPRKGTEKENNSADDLQRNQKNCKEIKEQL